MVDITRDHALGDQSSCEALIRLPRGAQAPRLFRRIELLVAEQSPTVIGFAATECGRRLHSCKSTWAVLALTCHIEIYAGALPAEHRADQQLSPLYKDFLFHWKEESRTRSSMNSSGTAKTISPSSSAMRHRRSDRLLAVLTARCNSRPGDAEYFAAVCGRLSMRPRPRASRRVLAAYAGKHRFGRPRPRFGDMLAGMLDSASNGASRRAAPIASRNSNRLHPISVVPRMCARCSINVF